MWIKATDAESGEMAAAAAWRFELNSESTEEAKEPASASSDTGADKNEVEASEPDDQLQTVHAAMWAEMGRLWSEFIEKNHVYKPRASALKSTSLEVAVLTTCMQS